MCSPSGNKSDALPEVDGLNMESLVGSQKNQCPLQCSRGLATFYPGSINETG